MLAGYLPFDDDPDNPDGDNITLLYRYIISTELAFPDYIGYEARDLLKMMLVPDPSKRCTIQDIMQHPWLAPYAEIFKINEPFVTKKPSSSNQIPSATSITQTNQGPSGAKRHTIQFANKRHPSSASNSIHNIDEAPEITQPETPIPSLTPRSSVPSSKANIAQNQSLESTTTNTTVSVAPSFNSHDTQSDAMISDIGIPEISTPKSPNSLMMNYTPSTQQKPLSTSQPLNPFDPTSIVMFSEPIKPTNNTQKSVSIVTNNKPKPVSSHKPPPNSSRNRPVSLLPPISNHTPSPPTPSSPIIPKQRPMSMNPKPSQPVPNTDSIGRNSGRASSTHVSNRIDPRKALSYMFDPNNSSASSSRGGTAISRKSNFSPTSSNGNTAKRISDWFRRKSIVKGNYRVPEESLNGDLNPRPEINYKLRYHTGAVDQFALTSRDPLEIITEIKYVLKDMGFVIDKEAEFKVRCIRPRQASLPPIAPLKKSVMTGLRGFLKRNNSKYDSKTDSSISIQLRNSSPSSEASTPSQTYQQPIPDSLYGDLSIDSGEEVRFNVELCAVKNFPNLYILDMKRLKGNVWGYKYLYHLILERLQLNQNGGYLNP
jgi:hypothetical protein